MDRDMLDFDPKRVDFVARATGRAGHRYNATGGSTLREKPGVGSKGADAYNDSLMTYPMPRMPRLT